MLELPAFTSSVAFSQDVYRNKSRLRDFGSRKVWKMRRKVLITQYRNQQLTKPNGHVRFSRNGNRNRLVKSCTLEPGGLFTTKDFEEGVQSLDTAITDMSGCSLNYWLSKFVQEVSNSSGERYPSRSLYSIICGLKRHLSDVNGSAALNPLEMSDRR